MTQHSVKEALEPGARHLGHGALLSRFQIAVLADHEGITSPLEEQRGLHRPVRDDTSGGANIVTSKSKLDIAVGVDECRGAGIRAYKLVRADKEGARRSFVGEGGAAAGSGLERD